MKRLLKPCRCHRESLFLFASGLLSGTEMEKIEAHLGVCSDCRRYYREIQQLIAPLAGWEKHFTHIEPGISMCHTLAKELETVRRQRCSRWHSSVLFVMECWQKLIWPSRHIWAGLTVVWLALLAANFSLHDNSHQAAAESSPTPEMIATWRQQEKVLTELIGAGEARASGPTKLFSPRPRTERPSTFVTV